MSDSEDSDCGELDELSQSRDPQTLRRMMDNGLSLMSCDDPHHVHWRRILEWGNLALVREMVTHPEWEEVTEGDKVFMAEVVQIALEANHLDIARMLHEEMAYPLPDDFRALRWARTGKTKAEAKPTMDWFEQNKAKHHDP